MKLYLFDAREVSESSRERIRERFPDRYAASLRFLKEERKRQCIGAGVLLDRVLKADEDALSTGEHGKPFLKDGCPFNLSHAGNFVLLAVGNGAGAEVGADLEKIRKPDGALLKRIANEAERTYVTAVPNEEAERFTRLWTLKESILKARGTGLTEKLTEVNVLPALQENQPVEAFGKTFYTVSGLTDGYAFAAASETPVGKLEPKRFRDPALRVKTVLLGLLQWTWGLPQNLVGGILHLLLKTKKRVSRPYRTAVATDWNVHGSMSLGRYLFMGRLAEEEKDFVYAHEYGHTIQSLLLGPLYLVVIGLPSVIRANVPPFNRNWVTGKKSYYDFYPERWANALGKEFLS